MPNSLAQTFVDTWIVTKRNLIRYKRVPQLLIFSTIQPVMILLLFNYVFGGAIKLPPGADSYIDYLLPGTILQVTLFGATSITVGLAEDLSKGLIDRFRSLPMARVAVLAGWSLALALRTLLLAIILVLVAFAIGFRFDNNLIGAIMSIVLVVLFSFSISWISVWLGLLAKNAEAAQASFVWVFPFIFASAIFVPTYAMPGWLRVFAEHQPVTYTVEAVRVLMHGGDYSKIIPALLWMAGITALFMTLSVRRYRRSTS